jgi:hypothetical protein
MGCQPKARQFPKTADQDLAMEHGHQGPAPPAAQGLVGAACSPSSLRLWGAQEQRAAPSSPSGRHRPHHRATTPGFWATVGLVLSLAQASTMRARIANPGAVPQRLACTAFRPRLRIVVTGSTRNSQPRTRGQSAPRSTSHRATGVLTTD